MSDSAAEIQKVRVLDSVNSQYRGQVLTVVTTKRAREARQAIHDYTGEVGEIEEVVLSVKL